MKMKNGKRKKLTNFVFLGSTITDFSVWFRVMNPASGQNDVKFNAKATI